MTGHSLQERVARRLHAEGLGQTLRRALRATRRRLLRYDVALYLGVNLEGTLPPVRAKVNVEFRWAEPAEVIAMVAKMSPNEQANERRSGLPSDRHWLGLVDGHPAYICCAASQQTVLPEELVAWVGPPDSSSYIRGVYTVPEFRGLGLATAGLSALHVALQQDGQQRAWARARHENIPSLRSLIGAGMNIIGAESYWYLLGCRLGREWAPRS